MPASYDLIIRGGLVLDGTGAPGLKTDVALSKGKIARLGDLSEATAPKEIDAKGLAVAPGFIDLHSHTDLYLPLLPTAESLVHQGVTTVVSGQCGLSPAPLGPGDCRRTAALFGKRINHINEAMPWDSCGTLGGYLGHLSEVGTSVNVAPLVGQGVLRAAVVGFQAEPPDASQRAAIRRLAAEAMDHGAFGISAGLIYPPGLWADTDELADVVQVSADKGGLFFIHIRDEGDQLFESLEEALEIGRHCGLHTQISHFKAAGRANWDKSGPALEMLERAAESQPLGLDTYPYTSGATAMVALLPGWALQGGHAKIMARLADPEARARMSGDMTRGGLIDGDFQSVLIFQSKSRPDYVGHRVAELAAQAGKPPQEWLMDALLETKGDPMMAVFMMSAENRKKELAHPMMAVGTDGFGLSAEAAQKDIPAHPRSFGTFPKILGRYCREEKLIPLEEAVFKMTGLAARYLGLPDRGLIKEGLIADLTLFNPKTVIDTATYEKPNSYPIGIEYVLVHGQPVLENGKHTGARPGEVLRRG